MTIAEVKLVIEVYQNRKLHERQDSANFAYASGYIAGVTAGAYNPWNKGKVKVPSLTEFFPSLFESVKPKQQDWRVAKERLMRFAQSHNQKRRGEKQ